MGDFHGDVRNSREQAGSRGRVSGAICDVP